MVRPLLTGTTGVALIGLLIQIGDLRHASLFLLVAAVWGFAAGLAAYALSLSQVEWLSTRRQVSLRALHCTGDGLLELLGLIPMAPRAGGCSQPSQSHACWPATGIHIYACD